MKQASSDPIQQAAINWAVRLAEGTPSADDLQLFEQWLCADEHHRRAWERIEQRLSVFATVREHGGGGARKALSSPRGSRRKLLGTSFGLLLTFGFAERLFGHARLGAHVDQEFTSDSGRRQVRTLADGTKFTLDVHSSANVTFSANARSIHLLRGQLFLRVGPDIHRPLTVSTRDGSVTALGTAFAVSLTHDCTRVAVTHSSVLVHASGGSSLMLAEGAVAMMRHGMVDRIAKEGAKTNVSWISGYFNAVDRPLREVVAAISPYMYGLIFLSPSAAALQVSGLFILDDPAASLGQIAQTLPVSVTYLTNYIVRIVTH